MSGDSVIAGPEIDMVELDSVSSSPFAVDLNLNLGPSFALELAVGGQGFHNVSATVSRQNWPRFEPGILAGVHDDETLMADNLASSTMASNNNNNRNRSGEIGSSGDANRFAQLTGTNTSNSRNGAEIQDLEEGADDLSHAFGRDNQTLGAPRTAREESSMQSPPPSTRNPHHIRHPRLRRPRLALFTPSSVLVGSQASSDHESNTESRVALPVGFARTTNPSLEISLSNESNETGGKEIQTNLVGVHFECNICLEMAVEPVVTCCGHLFCWPCLYKWLHLHSSKKECPVCKGFLSDDVITPIYGRGTSENSDRPHGSTPPRPHAHRINGKRQWQEEVTHESPGVGGRSDTQAESSGPEASHNAELILNRLRIAQRLQREHLDERLRLRLRQRMMGRRGGVLHSFSALEAATRVLVTPVPSSEDHWSGGRQRLVGPEENVQGNSLSTNGHGDQQNGESASPLLLQPSSDEEQISTVGRESNSPGSTSNGELQSDVVASGQASLRPWQRSMIETESVSTRLSSFEETHLELPQPPWGSSHRGYDIASSSFDAESESLHVRKRRRLN